MERDKYKLSADDVKLDQNFVDKLIFDVLEANRFANGLPMFAIMDMSKVKEALNDVERDKGEVEAIVNSIVNKAYYDKSKQNYLSIAAELTNKLANKHAFFDSNKRTAFISGLYVIQNGLNKEIDIDGNNEKYIDFVLKTVKNWKQIKDDNEQVKIIEGFFDKEVENALALKAIDEYKKTMLK